MTTFSSEFGLNGDSTRLYYTGGAWQTNADNPPAGSSVWNTVEGAGTSVITADRQEVGRVS